MYIRNKRMGTHRYYIIEDRIKKNGKYLTINVRYLGTAKRLLTQLRQLDQLKRKKPLT